MQKDGKAINEAVAEELLAKFWDPKGYKSKIDEQRDYAEAKAILKVFLEEQAKNKSEIVDIERWFETSIGDIKLRGRIDRIDQDESGYTVVDYKTSKKASSLNDLKKDMQLLVYALAVKQMYGGGPLKVGNWFLRINEKVFFEPENQAIDAIQTEITEIAAKIKAAAFEPKKGSWECNYCDYTCLCEL
jgi:DNA helicase-2/ATP-dependent DNA helicase PcrA